MKNKNTILFVFIFIGLAIILVWQFGVRNIPIPNDNQDETGRVGVVGGGTDLDSDNDGSPDWEELLWGYDPHDPDTGDEGRFDGLKIAEKKYTAMESIGIKPTGTPPEENITEQFGQDLYASIALLEQSGQLNQENIQALVDSAGSSLLQYGQLYLNEHIFPQDEIPVVPSTEENLTLYFEEMDQLHTKYPAKETDFVNLRIFMESGEKNEDFQEEMGSLYGKYSGLSNELKVLETPSELVEIQYGLINNLSILASLFRNLSLEKPDETKILIDAMMYVPALNNLEALYIKLDNFMRITSQGL